MCVSSPGVMRFWDLNMSGLAALHGNLNSIFLFITEHDLRFLKDTQPTQHMHIYVYSPRFQPSSTPPLLFFWRHHQESFSSTQALSRPGNLVLG